MVFPFNIFFGFEIIIRSIRIVLKFLFDVAVTVRNNIFLVSRLSRLQRGANAREEGMLRQMLISPRWIDRLGVANTKQVGPISVPRNDRDKGMGKSGARRRGAREHFRATRCTQFLATFGFSGNVVSARRVGWRLCARVIFIRGSRADAARTRYAFSTRLHSGNVMYYFRLIISRISPTETIPNGNSFILDTATILSHMQSMISRVID